ncbi:MAG: hypothetical protein AB7V36_10615 [Bacteroidales bacterium]|jgi:hypothetical protein|nr:hypothetical protein [Bacteroidales bacterium]
MRNLLILLLLLSGFSALQAQVTEISIADDVCDSLSAIDFSKSKEEIIRDSKPLLTLSLFSHAEDIISIGKNYKAQNPDLSETDAIKHVNQEIIFQLMKKCVPFQRMTMFNCDSVPELSETTVLVGEAFTAMLIEKTKNQPIDQNIVDNCVVDVIDNYETKIIDSFGEKFHPDFLAEFNAYLLTRCEPYMHWTAELISLQY